MDGDNLVDLSFLVAGDIEHVFVLDGHVGCCPFYNALYVDAQHFKRAVGFGAVHHTVLADGFLGKSSRSLDKCLDGVDMSAYLIHAWTEHGSDNLYHILVAHDGGVDGYRVFVHQVEIGHVELSHAEHRVLRPCLAVNPDGLCVGVAGESSSIAE